MNLDLSAVDWNALEKLCDDCGDSDGSMFKELIVHTVLQIALQHYPSKVKTGKGNRTKMERELAALKMKKGRSTGNFHI